MNQHSLRCLEYYNFLEFLAELAVTPLGKEACFSVRPLPNPDSVILALRRAREVCEFERTEGEIPLSRVYDLRPHMKLVRAEGAILDARALLEIKETLVVVSQLRSLEEKCGEFYPNLKGIFSDFEPLDELSEKIGGAISEWGTIRDTASVELEKIRKDLHRIRRQINREVEGFFSRRHIVHIFQDRLPVVRNNRFVLPIRAESKRFLEGIVHDSSQSGSTVYVEPFELVPLNNEWGDAQQREKAEERRILLELTGEVRTIAGPISRNLDLLKELDCLLAKARMGEILRGRAPEHTRGELKLKDARHPILLLQYLATRKGKEMPGALKARILDSMDSDISPPEPVPISVVLSSDCHTLIISGPNAGGKTVALKTVGLLVLMHQSGIPIPVSEGSKLPFFGSIFADIGDEQSLQAHLSTFSANIRNLTEILTGIDEGSIVLLDELGTGTDPSEGAALALAVLDYLRSKKAYSIVTTHHHALKTYGATTPGVENAAVSFDEETGRPTYELIYGYSGASNALKIAAQHGFPEDILETARDYLDEREKRGQELLWELENVKRESEEIRHALNDEKRYVGFLKRDLEAERENLKLERDKILEEAFREVKIKIERVEKDFKRILSELRTKGLRQAPAIRQEISQIKSEVLNDLRPKVRVSSREQALKGKVEVGKGVKILSCGKVGELIRVSKEKGEADVLVGSVQFKVSLEDLIPCEEERKKQRYKMQAAVSSYGLRHNAPHELNIIGKTVEEAISEVDKAIDAAILAGLDKIMLIHGYGTGRLRAGIHSYLSSNPQVKDFYFPEFRKGGRGVTVVELID